MPKAFSYIRFSSKKQMSGNSLERQTEKAQQYIVSHPDLNLTLDKSLSFQDLGLSAFRGKNVTEGELSEFLEAVKSGLVERGSYLIVENLDRVSRLPFKKAARVLEDICELDINVVTLSDGTIYTKESDLADYIRAALEFERAHKESLRKSELSNANWKKLRKKALDNKVMSNNVVSWLKVEGEKDNRHFVINEDKASIVKMIINMFLSGRGCQAIATSLNVKKIPMLGKGKLWLPRSIHSILSNPAICGRYLMGEKSIQTKEPPIDNYYPALISVEKYNEINLMLNRGNVKQRDEIVNPIAGICYCSICGAKMTRFKTKSHGERLICSAAKVRMCGGGYRTIKLALVFDTLKTIIGAGDNMPVVISDKSRDKILALRGQKADLDLRIDRLANELSIIGGSEGIRRALATLEGERATIDAAIDQLASESIYAAPEKITARMIEAKSELANETPDLRNLNGILRRLFKALTVDIRERVITYQWIDGHQSEIEF